MSLYQSSPHFWLLYYVSLFENTFTLFIYSITNGHWECFQLLLQTMAPGTFFFFLGIHPREKWLGEDVWIFIMKIWHETVFPKWMCQYESPSHLTSFLSVGLSDISFFNFCRTNEWKIVSYVGLDLPHHLWCSTSLHKFISHKCFLIW